MLGHMLMMLSMVLDGGRLNQRLVNGGRNVGGNREKFLQAINQFYQLSLAGKQLVDLGTKFSTFSRSLLVGKYVVIILHGYKTSRKSYHRLHDDFERFLKDR
jgi:hypothetical protein